VYTKHGKLTLQFVACNNPLHSVIFPYKQEGDETKASIHNATKYALNCASLQAHVVALGVAVVVGLTSPSVAKEMYACAFL